MPSRTAQAVSFSAFALAALPAAAVFAATPAAKAVPGVQFVPHRAVYEISLAQTGAAAGVEGLTGRMVYEFNGSSCDGYAQSMRFVSRMTNPEGAETVNDLRNTSIEDSAGKTLKFSSSQYQNDKLSESSQGDVSRGKADAIATVALVKPTKRKVVLPGDVYFPMQHAKALIEAARRGETLYAANLYDGAEKGDKYYLTSTVIGRKAPGGGVASQVPVAGAEKLASVESWPMSISYFEPGSDRIDAMPAYELAVRYYENGVTGDLRIDYGAFAIKGVLKELKFLDPGECRDAPQQDAK